MLVNEFALERFVLMNDSLYKDRTPKSHLLFLFKNNSTCLDGEDEGVNVHICEHSNKYGNSDGKLGTFIQYDCN